ncbi:bifunctional diguanylate cyclase/phosphodiesterase [Sphingomonas hankookensis]|uniref:bifunctional diguanylate cyclase/phosphodiesterase n=1 Tax=Sphingomonas hankookensis TaxID=563996 RepID=UPI00234F1C20|nr:bifunctional diguanylate cyclase/phosphodiesterase [Sphingomonas hankookensis]WCP73992.1 EAL domain-containing protein [Sphingomonas hankookensis]
MRFLTCLTEEHNLALVGLAAWFCLVGSMITIRLLDRIRHAERASRIAWVFLGGAATGATIWCTHFIAMIAYQPGVEVAYEPRLTGISLLLAILGSAGALHLTTRRGRPSAALGGALFGLTVSAMHYIGMQAFVANGLVRWSPAYVAASVLFAVALGVLAFDRARAAGRFAGPWWATALMVGSIVLLHFTGMAAMTVTPFAPVAGQFGSSTATIVMAIAVAGVGTVVIGTGLATYILDSQARADTRRRLHELLESNVDGMAIVQDGAITATNAAFATLVGGGGAIVGQPLACWIADIATATPDRLVQLTLVASDGSDVPVEVAVRFDQRRACPQTIYSIRDLRARIAQERRIAHLARNDSLTGLPNRTSFLEWLARQTGADSPHRAVALLSIDLDRFKEVNDMHGHAAGDQLLVRIAERMQAALLPGEFIARLGGDEFVAVMPVAEPDDAVQLIDRLRDAITAPVMIEASGIEANCGMSIGVALWPRDATELSALINNADLAMYRAKAAIAVDACFYEEHMDKTVRVRRQMVQELRTAIDRNELALHWQVQESVGSGAITGYEALLRWTRADGSSVSPAHFIPLAEQSGLILPIGEWVLRTACTTAASWAEPHRIAVNLSPVQLGHVDLPRLVQQVLLDTGLSPARLELEITETAMITDPVRTIHVLRQLKAIGVTVAMDDFGTGYSSLSTLRSFPFDKIKLDRSFMAELNGAPQSAAIIRAVLTLGESLDIPVLAEGVETVEQLAFLREQGCDEAQGYLLGRPGPLPARGRAEAARLAG